MFITALSVLAEFTLFVSSVVLWVKDSYNKRANRFLGLAFGLTALLSVWMLLLYYAYSQNLPFLLKYFLPLEHVFIMFIGPAFYAYVLILFDPSRRISPRQLVLHALPALPAAIYVVFFIRLPLPVRIGMLTREADPRHWLDVVFDSLFCVQCSSYFLICLVKVIKQRESNYILKVNGFKTNLRWLYLFLVLSLTGLFFYIPLNIVHNCMDVQIGWGAAFIALPAIYFFIHSAFVTGLSMQHPVKIPHRTGRALHLDEHIFNDYLKRIIEAVETYQLYLQPAYTLQLLSIQTGINQNYITHVINSRFNQSFSEFINEYRCRHALVLLEGNDYKRYTAETIAEDCGFGNRASFHSTFKKVYGTSPHKYHKSLKKK